MKKYTHKMLDDFTRYGLYLTIDQLQAELEKKSVPSGNGMTVEEIRKKTGLPIVDCMRIQPLTVAQGFQPDWSKAPEWAIGANIVFSETGEWDDVGGVDKNWKPIGRVKPDVWIDRPPKVTRERTREEKIHAIKYYLQTPVVRGFEPMSDKLIDDLCTAAGISLTEEV